MTDQPTYRALVVDDERTARRMLTYALEHEGFQCDTACDGAEASALLARTPYDLLVTDLRMPNRNGHSLAVEALAQRPRPVILIHTMINDQRLTRDLLSRGVDDIYFKPTSCDVLAARARYLVERAHETRQAEQGPPDHARHEGLDVPPADSLPAPADTAPPSAAETPTPVSVEQLTARLAQLATVLPMSQAALDVVEMVREGDCSAQQVAAAIARDPSLAIDVLKMANSSFYNPTGQKISEMERAVMRIGLRRVGELAMAATALTGLTTNMLPWLDVSLAWRRSIAAGLAVDSLVDQAGLTEEHEGLFLSALMHGLGRIALGTLFPDEYAAMIGLCKETQQPLIELERQMFPETHAETMVRLLDLWKLPGDICQALQYSLIPFSQLGELAPGHRKKVALLKLGVLIGELAVGKWEPWDLVDVPGAEVIETAHLDAVSAAVEQTRVGLFHVVNFRQHASGGRASGNRQEPVTSQKQRLAYCRLSPQSIDMLPHVIEALGYAVEPRSPAELDYPGLVNAFDGPDPQQLERCLERLSPGNLVVVDRRHEEMTAGGISRLTLPCSFVALQSACRELALRESAHGRERSRAIGV